jgi:hypothetical protein
VLAGIEREADPRVGLFMQMIRDLLIPNNFVGHLNFFTASFTAERDDSGQWLTYGDRNRGYALGFAADMFKVVGETGLEPNEMSFLGPVLYDHAAIYERHKAAIDIAASIFLTACNKHAGLMTNKNIGLPFMRRMANELIASPLIWNCITSKRKKYEHEHEVRLVLMGQTSKLQSYVKTRMYQTRALSYVAHPFRIREPGAIHEIVIGPAAGDNAESRVRAMLDSHGLSTVRITRSTKPV